VILVEGEAHARLAEDAATDGGTAVFAATFCVPRPPSPLLVSGAGEGLPGPGALLLPVEVKVIP
jgi:hypothetical protein